MRSLGECSKRLDGLFGWRDVSRSGTRGCRREGGAVWLVMAAALLLAPWPAVRGQDGSPELNGPGQQADADRMAAYGAEGGVPEDASLVDGWLGDSVLEDSTSEDSTSEDSTSEDSTSEDSTSEDSTSEGNAWHAVDDTDSPVEPEITRPVESLEGPWALENQALRDHIRRTLAYYFYRPETTARRSPWEVMHAVIGFGVDTPLMIGDREVNAIAWLCANGPCYNMRLMSARDGRLYLRRGPGFEGHAGQLLTVLAQSRVPVDYPIRADGQFLTVADLVRSEQMHCRSGGELTFQLIGLAYYLDPEARWENDLGQSWDLPRMIKEEIEQPIVGAACGGTHRLTALSYAVRSRERSGQPVNGQWKRAQSYLEAYYEHTLKLQNPDGSFSTSWFAERGDYRDIHRKLNTTGHTAEWLVYSLPEERLTEPQVVRAIRFLTDLLWQYRGQAWSLGAQGHAIHALCLFDERVFDGRPGQRATQLAGTLANAESAAEMTAAETGGVRMEQQEPARNGPFLRRMRR